MPRHPANDGVTVMVAVSTDPVLLVAVKAAMFPFPVEASPIFGEVFVQAKLAPGVPEKATAVVLLPAQTV